MTQFGTKTPDKVKKVFFTTSWPHGFKERPLPKNIHYRYDNGSWWSGKRHTQENGVISTKLLSGKTKIGAFDAILDQQQLEEVEADKKRAQHWPRCSVANFCSCIPASAFKYSDALNSKSSYSNNRWIAQTILYLYFNVGIDSILIW